MIRVTYFIWYYLIISLLNLLLINSFKYKELKIVKTYDWIQATATSNNNNKYKLTNKINK